MNKYEVDRRNFSYSNNKEKELSQSKTIDAPLSELGLIDIGDLLVFRQSRDGAGEEYNDLTDLARAIARNGLYHNLVACCWDYEGVKEYIETVSNLPGNTEYDVDAALKQMDKRKDRHTVLIAGHRRRAAIQFIREKGPDFLWDLEGYNGLNPEGCYKKIFSGGLVPVKIYQGISAHRALGIQMDENLNRDEVPMPVQARAIQILFHLAKEQHIGDRSLSVASFCRDKGLSERIVRNAISFRERLPQAIIAAVEHGEFKWSCAIELTKISRILESHRKPNGEYRNEEEINEELIRLAACEAAASSVKAFQKYLKTWVDERCGQLTLDTGFELTADVIQHHLLDQESIAKAIDFQRFILKVAYAVHNGWIGPEGTLVPLHRREARKVIGEMLRAQEALNSLLNTLLPGEEYDRLVKLTEKNSSILEQMNQLVATS